MNRQFTLLRDVSAAASLASTLSGCALAGAMIMGGDTMTIKSLQSPDELALSPLAPDIIALLKGIPHVAQAPWDLLEPGLRQRAFAAGQKRP